MWNVDVDVNYHDNTPLYSLLLCFLIIHNCNFSLAFILLACPNQVSSLPFISLISVYVLWVFVFVHGFGLIMVITA